MDTEQSKVWGLFVKKLLYIRCHFVIITLQLLFSFLLIVLGLAVVTFSAVPPQSHPLDLRLDMFRQTIVPVTVGIYPTLERHRMRELYSQLITADHKVEEYTVYEVSF